MPSVRSLALLGNVVALALVCLLCGAGDVLYADADPAPAGREADDAADDDRTSRDVLLIVVDGLRLDTSLDPATMPRMVALGQRGRRTELLVEALVPSTIAALHAMVEGRRVAPVAALQDFGAAASPDGGFIERLAARGGRTVVAATHLWEGLYGRFLEPGLAVPGLPGMASDAAVFRTALDALGAGGADAAPDTDAGGRIDLVVAHFGALDAAGHRHGGASAEYRATAARIDSLAGDLADRALADGRTVVWTSDHGTTDAGGHAGGEPVVRRVPLVVAGGTLPARLGALAPTRQVELPALLDAALGLIPADTAMPESDATVATTDTTDTVGTSAAATRSSGSRTGSSLAALVACGTALIACGAALIVVAARASLVTDARASTLLSAALWVTIGTGVLVGPAAAAALGTLVLAAVAATALASARTRPSRLGPCGLAAACGVLSAAAWCLDATSPTGLASPALAVTGAALAASAWRGGVRDAFRGLVDRPGARGAFGRRAALVGAAGLILGGPWLATLAVLALVAGSVTALTSRTVAAGIALALVPVALSRLAGDTASLSSIDVGLAHRMAESPFGLAGAVATALARLALLPLAGIVGHGLVRGLHCRSMTVREPTRAFDAVNDRVNDRGPIGGPDAFDALAATQLGAGFGFAAALGIGAALAALATPADPPVALSTAGFASGGVPAAAAGLGGLLRELDLAVWYWLAAAALAAGHGAAGRTRDRARRNGDRHRPIGTTERRHD